MSRGDFQILKQVGMCQFARFMIAFFLALLLCVGCLSQNSVNFVGLSTSTPRHCKYGEEEARLQLFLLYTQLIDRWFERTGYKFEYGKPSLSLLDVENRTDIDIRPLFQAIVQKDGRFELVEKEVDDLELSQYINRLLNSLKYYQFCQNRPYYTRPPKLVVKLKLEKTIHFHHEHRRLLIAFYDPETKEICDLAWDDVWAAIE